MILSYVGSVTPIHDLLKMLSLQLKPPGQATGQTTNQALFSVKEPFSRLTPLLSTSNGPTHVQLWEASLIQLNFSELQSFEVVRDQYQQWGIEFEQTIALQPSNPMFDDLEQPVGLMPIAHPFMAVQFHQPRQIVKATLVGARAMTVTAFDVNNRVLSRHFLDHSAPNLKTSASDQPEDEMLPLHTLHLQAEAIARVELTSAAPFLLRHFCCI